MTPAQNKLVLDNLGIAHTAARWGHRRSPTVGTFDDYYQEATLGLIQAALTYSDAVGVKFITWAWRPVWWRVRKLASGGGPIRFPRHNPYGLGWESKSWGHVGRLLIKHLVAEVDVGRGQDNWLEDKSASDIDAREDREETLRQLYRLLRTLPVEKAKILKRRYGLNGRDTETLQAIGDSLGITKEAVRCKLLKSIRKLREVAGRMGEERI